MNDQPKVYICSNLVKNKTHRIIESNPPPFFLVEKFPKWILFFAQPLDEVDTFFNRNGYMLDI